MSSTIDESAALPWRGKRPAVKTGRLATKPPAKAPSAKPDTQDEADTDTSSATDDAVAAIQSAIDVWQAALDSLQK